MEVLAVAPYVPFERIPHAGGQYLLRHLEAIARNHRVSLIVPGSTEAQVDARHAPAWLDLILGPMDIDGRSTSRWLRDAAYRRLMASPPAPSAEMLRAVMDAGLIERARAADIVELHWPEFVRFATVLRRERVTTPIVAVEYDVDLYAVARRIRRYGSGYRRLLGLATSRIPQWRERRGLQDADLVLVFKGADEELLRRAGVKTPVRVVDPWLDEPTGPEPDRVAQTVLFAGAMWRDENEEAVLWFLDNVWPAVRAAVPDAQMTVAGSAPRPRLRTTATQTGGVVVTGDVPDLLPYYRTTSLFVAPLLTGGGLKFKVPQAMMCGAAVVATSCAAQGVVEVAPPGTFWAIADSAGDMVDAVIAALLRPEAAAEVARRAQAWCRHHYSFERSLAQLLDAYELLRTHGQLHA